MSTSSSIAQTLSLQINIFPLIFMQVVIINVSEHILVDFYCQDKAYPFSLRFP